jgi:GAF domain-containing protein
MPSRIDSVGDDHYGYLFANMSEGVALHTILVEDGRPADYVIDDVNPAYEAILGLPRATTVGRRATAVYRTENPPYLDVFSRVAASGMAERFETYFPPMDKHFTISVFAISESRFGTVFLDVTSAVRRRHLSAALDRIGQALMSSLDFDSLMREALREAVLALDARSAAFLVPDGDGWLLRLTEGFPQSRQAAHLSSDEAMGACEAARTRRPVFVEDTKTDPRANPRLAQRLAVESFILVPLLADDEVIGVFDLNFSTSSSFTEEDLDFAAVLSASLSLAVQNARRYETLREVSELNEALTRIDASLNSVLDVDEIMRRVVTEAAAVMHCESSALDFRTGSGWAVRYAHGLPADSAGRWFADNEVSFAALAADARQPIAISNALDDEHVDPEVQRRFGVRSVLAVPIIVRDETISVLFFNYHSKSASFSEAQIEFARKLGSTIGLAYENARLYELEHHIAETLQATLLVMPPAVAGVEFDYLYESATEAARVGGDFLDVFEVQPHVIGLLVGDVSGKGVRATSLMVLTKNIIKALAFRGFSPAEVLDRTNDVVLRESEPERFVALFFGLLDVKSGHLEYVRAGLPAAVLLCNDGEVQPLETTGPVIGALEHVAYEHHEASMTPGDLLLLCTDGITEARDSGGALFGRTRLLEAVRKAEAPGAIPGAVFDAVAGFTGGTFSDDMALLTLRLSPDKPTASLGD